MIEIYTLLENGGEFVIDRLYRGSILNHRSFLLRDKIAVYGRCTTPVSLYSISLDKFYEIRGKYPEFD
jgi:CRP-like cAMP-binding protein